MLTALRIKHQNELRRNRSGQIHFVRVLLGQEDLPVGDLRENQGSEGPPSYRWQLRLREITPYLATKKKH